MNSNQRFGVATVELVLTIPVLVIVVFGSLELCKMVVLRQTTFRIAYDTVREMQVRELSQEQGKQFAIGRLQEESIEGTVKIELQQADDLQSVNVLIDARYRNGNPVLENFFRPEIATSAHILRRPPDPGNQPVFQPGSGKKGKGNGKGKSEKGKREK